jgi:hypothetical protein
MALDGIQKLCSITVCSGGVDSTPVQPFGRPHEREERKVEGAAHQEERRAPWLKLCVLLSS